MHAPYQKSMQQFQRRLKHVDAEIDTDAGQNPLECHPPFKRVTRNDNLKHIITHSLIYYNKVLWEAAVGERIV